MRQFFELALMLFVVLGPARLAQALESFPGDLSERQARSLAVRAVAIATAVTLALALLGVALRRTWDLSWGAAGIAMGLILLAGALHGLFPGRTARAALPDGGAAGRPLPAPVLLSPFGMAVVLLGITWAPSWDARLDVALAVVLLAVMGMNLACLLQARRITAWLGAPGLRVVGWTAAILLAAFAVQVIVSPVQNALLRCSLQDDDDLSNGSMEHIAAPARAPDRPVQARRAARRLEVAHAHIGARPVSVGRKLRQ